LAEFFLQNFWAGLGAWIVLYISDYTLTITCARLYQGGVREKLAFEGSYELTPFFQRDVDSLRRISPRFIFALLTTSAMVFAVRWVVPEMYAFLLGALILAQLAVHTRHIRNLYIFRAAATDSIRGRIEYSKRTSYRISAVESLSFCGLYLVLFAFTDSWFILGGSVSCLSLSLKHWRLARKHVSTAVEQQKASAATPS
jgi:hypothetical protein